MAAFVSTHRLREHYLPRSLPKQTRYALVFSSQFLSLSFSLSDAFFFPDNHVTAALLTLLLAVSVSASFPATPGWTGRGGEGMGVTACAKKGWALLSLAPNGGIIQISSVDTAQLSPHPVNPLRASAQQSATQRQRQQESESFASFMLSVNSLKQRRFCIFQQQLHQ